MARVLPLRCFLYLLPNHTNILEPEVFLPKYSQTAIHAAHFRLQTFQMMMALQNVDIAFLPEIVFNSMHRVLQTYIWIYMSKRVLPVFMFSIYMCKCINNNYLCNNIIQIDLTYSYSLSLCVSCVNQLILMHWHEPPSHITAFFKVSELTSNIS